MSVNGSGIKRYVPSTFQPVALLDQAAPVQNTYYTILPTTQNINVFGITIRIATTGEDLQVRITIDGQVFTLATAICVADTNYSVLWFIDGAGVVFYVWAHDARITSFNLQAKSIKVEVRKTTAAGNGNLLGAVAFGKW